VDAAKGIRPPSDCPTSDLKTSVDSANDGVCGDDFRSERWSSRYFSSGERTPCSRVVNCAEIVDGKIKIDVSSAIAE
jgi:hypothetical protein